jgi:single-strand DNA-binding protein
MPADLNHVTLVGRLTRDPELRYTAGGDPVCGMRLAVTSRARDDNGWADRPNFFDVTAFGPPAEAAAEHLTKGRRVGVAGRRR